MSSAAFSVDVTPESVTWVTAAGRLLMFQADAVNPHFVAKVTAGRRHLFSVWLTSNPLHGHND